MICNARLFIMDSSLWSLNAISKKWKVETHLTILALPQKLAMKNYIRPFPALSIKLLAAGGLLYYSYCVSMRGASRI